MARTSSGASVSTVDLAKWLSPLDVAVIMPDVTQPGPSEFNLRGGVRRTPFGQRRIDGREGRVILRASGGWTPRAQRDAAPALESRTCGFAVAALGSGSEPFERIPCHATASANSQPGKYLPGLGAGRGGCTGRNLLKEFTPAAGMMAAAVLVVILGAASV